MTLTLNSKNLKGWSPDRMDPTRTGALRRAFLAEIRRRFREVRRRVVELVRDEDAFGLTTNLASTQVDLPGVLPAVRGIQRRLDPADVLKLEDNPHVTVLYGLLTEDVAPIQETLRGIGVLDFTLGELGSFSNPEGDVLLVKVSGAKLNKLNALLDLLPNENRFDDYRPHLTVAYLKPGTASKYLSLDNPLQGWHVETRSITFSDSERIKSSVTLNSDGLTANARFDFMSTPDQLKAFQAWIRKLLASQVVGRTEDELWRKYVEEGFKKGAGRSFDDVRQSQLRKEKPELFTPDNQDKLRDFYDGSKEQFLKSAFGRPIGIEKVKVLAARTFTDIQGVTDQLASRLGRTLADGMVQGKHALKIAKNLAADMDWALPRAERVARTEVSRAYVEGQLDAMEQMGVEELGVMVEWFTAGDTTVCPLCVALEGVVLKTEEAHGMFPRHPNCRCALIAAQVGESEESAKLQKKGKAKVDRAIKRSVAEEGGETAWAGAGKRISKVRPENLLGNQRFNFLPLVNCGGKGGKPGPCPTMSEIVSGAGKKVAAGESVFPLAHAPYDKKNLGISRDQRLALPIEEVPIDKIMTVQRTVSPEKVAYFMAGGAAPKVGEPMAPGSKFLNVGPWAVKTVDGTYYLEDGNTRGAALVLKGASTIPLKVVELDVAGRWKGSN